MERADYLDFCRSIAGASIDQPFEDDFYSTVVRHTDTGKWFAVLLEHGGREFVNLKCEPLEAEFLCSAYAGVDPGYHMNKRHWISVYFGASDVPDALVRELTMASFRLTARKPGRLTRS